ncbi:pyrroloquinoline quinone biosynthesis protein PqqF [Ectopseudomonas guguanensis]|uniref:pyrroloquinoline quinone biosynthesis protein PqqF n=1 Tax=Ectopseudomonas guguanensis TaxID=1198456 RepID=UPI0028B097C0|nr:pyrroloquinoline quinone biosynthesis protein PqqF [Pseudomonas guguanensis]
MSHLASVPLQRLRLTNGAELCVAQQPWAERVGICLRVAAGSHDEPAAYPGLAHFLEHLLFLGSRGYGVEQGLMAYVQGCGGQVNASTQARHTDFVCALPAERLQPALARLLDMLRWPLLDGAAQRREREVLDAEYQARSQDADSRIDHALGQALAAGHRCGDFLAGDRTSLAVEQAAFQDALQGYHRGHYQAGNMRLTLVGPQLLAELLEIGRALLEELPAGAAVAREAPPSMLPLRAPRLGLQHAVEGLHLGYAVQLDEPGLQPALELLLDVLQDPVPGGLLAGLRAARLCRQLQARVLYRHAGQCLLRLDFAGAEAQRGGQLIAELQGWLARVRMDPLWPARLADWRQAQALRQLGAGPLALARSLQEPDTDDASLLLRLDALLVQLAEGAGLIELVCDKQQRPAWPAIGLALPLAALPARELPAAQLSGGLAAVESLLALTDAASPSLPPARLRHHPGAAAGGPAALHWRGEIAWQHSLPQLQAMLQARIADLQRACERLGVALQLGVEPGAWSLALQGAAALLPACSARLLPLLLAPLTEVAESAAEGLLLRQLLQRLPELGGAWSGLGLQGLSVGLGEGERAQLEALFAAVEPLAAGQPQAAPNHELLWREVAQPGSDAALVLLCPLADDEPRSEAAWRLLGQLLQGGFYRRLRGELQLGYALFAGYRQVQGERVLLFALQSPVCDAAGIFAHIRSFLDQQRQRIAELPDAEFERCREELAQALRTPKGNVARAEQLWQLQLAGLNEEHPQRVRRALAGLRPGELQAAYAQLTQSSRWRVLASGPRSNT